MNEKLKRAFPYAKYYNFIGWPFAGAILLVFTIFNFNKWGTTNSVILIVVSLFLIIYGSWAVKRAWKEL